MPTSPRPDRAASSLGPFTTGLALLLTVACSSGGDANHDGNPNGGAPGTGGVVAGNGGVGAGGTAGSGGSPAVGATTGAGGASARGGATGSGGAASAGGAVASGGVSARGGAGGMSAAGGTVATGGSPATSGGTAGAGGAMGAGGMLGSGGTIGAGGAGPAAGGGTSGTGGAAAGTGGTTVATGGAPAGTGGSTSSTGGTPSSCDPTAPSSGVFAAPTGSGSACTAASPCTLSSALGKASSTTTVYLRGGTYSGSTYLNVAASGSAAGYVVIANYPCELPIIDLGGTGSFSINGTYVSIRGIVAINGATGFGNKWTGGGTTNSNGHLEFINCIADMHSANGIAFRSATGVHIKQSIIAHTGFSTSSSWSSGVDLFGAQGTYQDNVVEQNIAFENMDNERHTDGSGFIVDDIGTGATFVNNIGFRNGGSCIRLTTSTGTHIINNSCYGNGLDPAATGPSTPDEIFFSSSATTSGAVMVNNIAVATGKGGDTQAIFGSNGSTNSNNVTNNTGTIDFWVDAAGTNPDYHLKSSATTLIGKGTGSEAPAEDIGFDPKCITKTAPTGTGVQSWWLYSIDYPYIKSIGGTAQCFHPKARDASAIDIGAYAY